MRVYPVQRQNFGRSYATTSASELSTAANRVSAYGPASCAYREVTGNTANTVPASRPTRGLASRLPITATMAAAATIASSDGNRSTTSAEPATSVTARISR